MNLSSDVQFLYKFHAKFTISADYEHMSVETEFNVFLSVNNDGRSF